MRIPTLILTAGILAALSGTANAADASCSARSGENTTALLELYTSEGCSSCPPADEWLAKLPESVLVPEKVVPLALHVDYWNHLGWVDPFSQKKFSDRQSRRTFLNQSRTIYTPQVVLNGHILPRWRQQADIAIPLVNATPSHADIALKMTRSAGLVDIEADARTRKSYPGQAEIYVAIYERNLVRRIEAGENNGHTLRHDFVVRELYGPAELDKTGKGRLAPQVKLDKNWKEADLGVASFVQNRDTGEVLQSVALAFCR
ncbi:MAG: DUF1223 domain-containing protein [Gammaproteobacteria bacterium]|nr:DUF1223 domain-containing protein [Gammaproteobacteria bacterium]